MEGLKQKDERAFRVKEGLIQILFFILFLK